MRILIADDDAIARKMLCRFLEEIGYEVDAVVDGEEAWAKFEGGAYSLVITDWMMPSLSGPELIRRIRARQDSRYVYTILLTAKSDKTDLVAGMQSGADDFVSKPFDRDELRVRVRAGERILDAERALQEAHESLARVHGRMKDDIEAAARFQLALLPQASVHCAGGTFAWRFQPCTELAGDILNVIPLGGQSTGFYVLDVTGHGVPAALLAVAISRALTTSGEGSSIMRERLEGGSGYRPRSPAEVLSNINSGFQMDETGGKLFTIGYAVFDADSQKVTYAAAGHPPAYKIAADGALTRLDSTGMMAGIDAEATYEQHEVDMQPGDRFLIFSDGLNEAENERGEPFGFERIEEQLRKDRQLDVDQALESLMQVVGSWSGHQRMLDDVTCLYFEVSPAPVAALQASSRES